ncbi:hypothetical protein F2Q68_00021576 [Brassica cretica]|uniref:Uncharacterized protein n=1 Tax=Brassica cretica TaxID=69181 RepID=A0A8S9FUF8_BRACR|nr:hypothetical protein F2Q68_00021576 [Brassica cretica]
MSRIHNRHGKDKDERRKKQISVYFQSRQWWRNFNRAGEGCSGITTKTIGEPTGKHFGGEDL